MVSQRGAGTVSTVGWVGVAAVLLQYYHFRLPLLVLVRARHSELSGFQLYRAAQVAHEESNLKQSQVLCSR